MYALKAFLDVLEYVLQTADQPYQQADGTASGPSLAEVLVSRYEESSYRLALDVEGECWWLSDKASSEYATVLVMDIPELVNRMYRHITEDGWESARVLDIDALRVQMQGEAQRAYEQKFGKAT
jgi:hypothetical protein